eukprot:scaffold1356_cov26-Tisochrysis_lutea.AAC.1
MGYLLHKTYKSRCRERGEPPPNHLLALSKGLPSRRRREATDLATPRKLSLNRRALASRPLRCVELS